MVGDLDFSQHPQARPWAMRESALFHSLLSTAGPILTFEEWPCGAVNRKLYYSPLTPSSDRNLVLHSVSAILSIW